MDHLTVEYGSISSIPVHCFAKQEWFQPTENDWIAYFHSFPDRMGWEVDNDGEITPKSGRTIFNLGHFLQSWLFFGLIFTVVRKNNESLLSFTDLLLEAQSLERDKHVSTSKLTAKLQEWVTWEVQQSEQQEQENAIQLRMIHIALILDKARLVVRRQCSFEEEKTDATEPKYYEKENDHPLFMADTLALSLMVLGETLSAVYNKIVKKLRPRIPRVEGWCKFDDNSGWGQPRYVVHQMQRAGWCPRTIHLLRRQLGSQASLLLNAYISYYGSIQLHTMRHQNCSLTDCSIKSETWDEEEGKKVYTTAHHDTFCNNRKRKECEDFGPRGPLMEHINQILDHNDIGVFPLLKLRLKDDEIEGVDVLKGGLEVKAGEYATISHVWSDGYGNEKENKLWLCQLKFIRRLLQKATGSDSVVPFWMDTLVIPVLGESADAQEKKRKKLAIRQIHTVFDGSAYSIVLDKGLINMDGGSKAELCRTAMKILASGWMRRLWTLQEAFLSKKLMIAFQETEAGINPLKDFDNLLQEIKSHASSVDTSVMAVLLDKELSHSIMCNDRRVRTQPNNDYSDNEEGRAETTRANLILIANSWRAARWRTTSNKAHETVALATLLGLQAADQASDKIAKAITDWPFEKKATTDDIEALVKEFWITVNRKMPGAIPPGLIFLPGKRVSLKGFGWAPYTFMVTKQEDYPDPLSILKKGTRLIGDGLIVYCPGYLLFFENTPEKRQKIIRTAGNKTSDSGFEFPVDSSFLERYHVEPASTPGSNEFASAVVSRTTRLAIITSRTSPKESPPEIGLLVEIYRVDPDPYNPRTKIFYAQILFRVHVRRSNETINKDHLLNSGIFGEVLEKDIAWCVDGYDPTRLRPPSPSIHSPGPIASSQQGSQKLSLARRAYTFFSRGNTTAPSSTTTENLTQQNQTTAPVRRWNTQG